MSARFRLSVAGARAVLLCVLATTWRCAAGSTGENEPATSAGASGDPGLGGAAGRNSGGAAGDSGAPAGGASAIADGEDCSSAQSLVVPRADGSAAFSLTGTTRGAGDDVAGESAACAGSGLGPDRFHRLDLGAFDERVRVRAVLDAEFDALLGLEQGPCEDLTPLFCDRASAAGRRSSSFTAELDPAEYLLVVDGAVAGDEGDYRLEVVVEPLEAGCDVPANSRCDTATPVATDLPTNTLFVGAHCAESDDEPPSLYYRIDLATEVAPVGIRASLEGAEDHAEESEIYPSLDLFVLDGSDPCGRLFVPYGLWGTEALTVSAGLPPGTYLLRIDEPPEWASFLRVEVVRQDCSSNTHDTCADAEDLVLENGFARVSANTYCNTDQFHDDGCDFEGPAPDRFYRVDLRDRSERTRVRARLAPRALDFYAGLVLLREEAGSCGSVLHCYDRLGGAEGWPSFDMVVEPGAYLIVIDGMRDNAAGSFTLEVEASDFRSRPYAACFDTDVDACAFFYNEATDCCSSHPFSPDCGTLFISCGLDPAIQDCVCESDPRCCNGDEQDFERCAEVFQACGYFCADEQIRLLACLDWEALRPPAGE